MEKIFETPQYILVENRIINRVKEVTKRGFDEIIEKMDDYSLLIENVDYKNAIITEIYENYFPPKRHEFEIQLIKDIVEALINSKAAIFFAGAAAAGLIGDTFTHIVKRILCKIIDGFKDYTYEKEKFETIYKDVKKVERFFKKNDKTEVKILSDKLKIEKERLIPLLKLLGYKTYKKKGMRYWKK